MKRKNLILDYSSFLLTYEWIVIGSQFLHTHVVCSFFVSQNGKDTNTPNLTAWKQVAGQVISRFEEKNYAIVDTHDTIGR